MCGCTSVVGIWERVGFSGPVRRLMAQIKESDLPRMDQEAHLFHDCGWHGSQHCNPLLPRGQIVRSRRSPTPVGLRHLCRTGPPRSASDGCAGCSSDLTRSDCARCLGRPVSSKTHASRSGRRIMISTFNDSASVNAWSLESIAGRSGAAHRAAQRCYRSTERSRFQYDNSVRGCQSLIV